MKNIFPSLPSECDLSHVKPVVLPKENEEIVLTYMQYVQEKMELDNLEDRYVIARPADKQKIAKLMVERAKKVLAALEKLA